MNTEAPKKTKRKKRYVPHEAAARFKPTEDWSKEQALKLFNKETFPFSVDAIHYEDCIEGMKSMPKESDADEKYIAIDPICGMKVDKRKAITRAIGGRTYYFCMESCANTFENPLTVIVRSAIDPMLAILICSPS